MAQGFALCYLFEGLWPAQSAQSLKLRTLAAGQRPVNPRHGAQPSRVRPRAIFYEIIKAAPAMGQLLLVC
jgi:hypothetical protein